MRIAPSPQAMVRPSSRTVPGAPPPEPLDVRSTFTRTGLPDLTAVREKCEADFLAKAAIVRHFGAGVVVMAFDEQGQADTIERKVSICQRAYALLTKRAGFDPSDPRIRCNLSCSRVSESVLVLQLCECTGR